MQRLKERLVARRNNLNFSQKALAERSGVSERSIAAYETGTSQPTHRQLEKLATALSVEPSWLLGAEEQSRGPMLIRDSPPFRADLDLKPAIPLELLPTGLLELIFNALLKTAEARENDRLRISHLLVEISQEMKSRPPEQKPEPSSASALERSKMVAAVGKYVKDATARIAGGDEHGRQSGAGERTSRKDQQRPASDHPSRPPHPAREEEGRK